MRWLLIGLMAVLLPLQGLRLLLRPLWRHLLRQGLSGLLRTARLAWRDPVAAAAAIAPALEHRPWAPARRLGGALRAWRVAQQAARPCRDAAGMAPPEVDGWLLLMPDFTSGLRLPGRKVVLFPDAIPFDFPFGWDAAEWEPGGPWDSWRRRAAETLSGADGVITFSHHVAERHVVRLFGVPPGKVATVPLAAPDLRPLLPVRTPDRTPTPASRRAAAEILRHHAAERGWPYLTGFPFEDVPYAVVSTQDRPTKNITLAVEAVRRLLRRDRVDMKLFMTARLEPGGPGDRLWRAVRDAGMALDALSVPDLPREVHAALYHCAALTVHPSFYEGIVGALPFVESISVGTPCIIARGPHSLELLEQEPALRSFLFDPYDAEALTDLIRRTVLDRPAALAAQVAILERLMRRNWGDVAEEYAAVVSGRPVGSVLWSATLACSAAMPAGTNGLGLLKNTR